MKQCSLFLSYYDNHFHCLHFALIHDHNRLFGQAGSSKNSYHHVIVLMAFDGFRHYIFNGAHWDFLRSVCGEKRHRENEEQFIICMLASQKLKQNKASYNLTLCSDPQLILLQFKCESNFSSGLVKHSG